MRERWLEFNREVSVGLHNKFIASIIIVLSILATASTICAVESFR